MLKVNELSVLNDNVLVEGIYEEKTGELYNAIKGDDKPQWGKILKVGPGRILDSGERSKMTVQEGQTILFNEYSTTKFKIEGKIYYVLREEDVVGFK